MVSLRGTFPAAVCLQFHSLYSLAKDLLSKQLHYDWGLRAIKSVLLVAGVHRREAAGHISEYALLLRALRDFNLPKLVGDDVSVFLALLSDLFPEVTAAPRDATDVRTCLSCPSSGSRFPLMRLLHGCCS